MFSGVHRRESMTRSWQVMQTSEGKEMRLYHFISWREIIWWILVSAASMKTSWIFLNRPLVLFCSRWILVPASEQRLVSGPSSSRLGRGRAGSFYILWWCRSVWTAAEKKKQQEPVTVHPLDFHHKDSLWCITSCIPEFTTAMPFNKNLLPHTSSSSDYSKTAWKWQNHNKKHLLNSNWWNFLLDPTGSLFATSVNFFF